MKNFLFSAMMVCLLSVALSSLAQGGHIITGKVIDDHGNKLPGVSVTIKGTNKTVATDNEGRFSIEVPAGKKWLTFSSVGFSAADINTGNENDIQVTLHTAVTEVGEVVVVGYGNQKKRTITSAISKVGELKPEENVVGNVVTALQGRVAGLTVQSQNGRPGSTPNFNIRGLNMVGPNSREFSTPLIVVDGMIVETGVAESPATTGTQNNYGANLKMQNINPQDIESIEVLKDAASAAIYGARGSQGVILITTKKGKLNTRPVVNLNTYYGIAKSAVNYRPMNVEEYKNLFITARENRIKDINNPVATESKTLTNQIKDLTDPTKTNSLFYRGVSDINWVDFLLPDNAQTKNLQASVSGGTDKGTYYLSAGLFDQDNANGYGKFSRKTFKLAVTQQASNWLKLTGDISATNTLSKYMLELYGQGITLRPDSPVDLFLNPDGTFAYTYGNQINPLAQLAANNEKNENWNFVVNTAADVKLYKGLTFRTSLSGSKNETRVNYFAPWNTPGGQTVNGRAQNGYGSGFGYTWNNLLSYSLKWKELDATAMTGYEFFSNKASYESIFYNGFPRIDGLSFPGNASAYEPLSPYNFSYTYQTSQSFFGRANLSWAGKYLLNLSLRRDGSSLLGTDNRNATFPAISGGWIVSEEKFMQSLDFISMLKLRASWGKTGSLRSLAPYPFTYSNLVSSGTYMGQNTLVTTTSMANPDIRWEQTSQVDLGADMSFFKNRVSFVIDYYNRFTDGFFASVAVPISANIGGFSSQFVNLGGVRNKGIDLELTGRSRFGANLNWTVSLLGNFNRNKIESLSRNPTPMSASPILQSAIVGHPIGTLKLYESSGVDPQTGDMMYVDQDKNGVINTSDQIDVDLGQPKFVGGMNFNVEYKGFSLGGTFSANIGRKVYDYENLSYRSSASYNLSGNVMANRPSWVLEGMWQKPGDIAKYPRAVAGSAGPLTSTLRTTWNTLPSTHYIVKGDYLKLQNLTLGYNLPKSLVSKASLGNVRLYVSGQNLLTIKDKANRAIDPETIFGNGINFGIAPLSRVYTFGVDVNF